MISHSHVEGEHFLRDSLVCVSPPRGSDKGLCNTTTLPSVEIFGLSAGVAHALPMHGLHGSDQPGVGIKGDVLSMESGGPAGAFCTAAACPLCHEHSRTITSLPPHSHVRAGSVMAFHSKFAGKPAEQLRMEYHNMAASASTRKENKVLHLLGDTGAFDHFMDRNEAERLGLDICGLPEGERVFVSTANGPVECNAQTWVQVTPGEYTPFTLLPDGQNMLSIGRYVIDHKYLFVWDGSHEILKWYPMLVAPPNAGPDLIFHVQNYVPRLTIMPSAYAAAGHLDRALHGYVTGAFGLAKTPAFPFPSIQVDVEDSVMLLEHNGWELNYLVKAGAYDLSEPFTPMNGELDDEIDLDKSMLALSAIVGGNAGGRQLAVAPAESEVQAACGSTSTNVQTNGRPLAVVVGEDGEDGGRPLAVAPSDPCGLSFFAESVVQAACGSTSIIGDSQCRPLAVAPEGPPGISQGIFQGIDDMTRPFETFTCDVCNLLGLQDDIHVFRTNGKTLELCVECRGEQASNAELLGLVDPNPAAAAPREVRQSQTLRTNLEGFVHDVWSQPVELLAQTFSLKHSNGPTYTLPPEWSEHDQLVDTLEVNLGKVKGLLGITLDENLCVTSGRQSVHIGDVIYMVNGVTVASNVAVQDAVKQAPDRVRIGLFRSRIQQGRECVHAEDRPRLHKTLDRPRNCNVIFYTHDGKSHKTLRKDLHTLRTNIANMPPWSKVCRRLVLDAKTGDVIEDIDIVHDHELHLFTAKGDSKSDRLNREARMKRVRHLRKPKWTASVFGGVISADSVGRIEESWQHHSYFSTGLDSHTGWIFADPLRSTTAEETMKVWSVRLSRCQREEVMYRIHSDGGPEFQAEFHQWCIHHGINHTKSMPHTPQGNSRIERIHGTINAAIRAALNVSGLPLAFWDSAMMHVVYSLNRQPRFGTDGRLPTPYEKRYARPYTGVGLVPFGCQATVVIHAREKEHKYGPSGEEVIIIGYCDGGKGYRVLPVALLKESRPTAYDVEIPESAIKATYFPVRRLNLLKDANYEPTGIVRNKCHTCDKWQVNEPITCPPCRARKAHRKHTLDWRCAKTRCLCEDWTSGTDVQVDPDADDGDEAQALADDVIDEYAATDGGSGDDAPEPERMAEEERYSPVRGGAEVFDYGGEFDMSTELPGYETDDPEGVHLQEEYDTLDNPFSSYEQEAQDTLDNDLSSYEQASTFWSSMSGGPTQASHRDGGPSGGPTVMDYGAPDAPLTVALKRNRVRRVREQLQLVRVSKRLAWPVQKSESLRQTSRRPPSKASVQGEATPQGEPPTYALYASKSVMQDRPPPGDGSLCAVCAQFRREHGNRGCLNWYTHVQTAMRDDPLPDPVRFTGYEQPDSTPPPKDDALNKAMFGCVAQLYRLPKAYEEDRKGVQAAIDKEQRKLIDKPPLGKEVFTESEVVDKHVLQNRVRIAKLKSRPPPLIRFSKILLKLYKKGVELPAWMQKWSARACVDGSWITDHDNKKASDQSPEENLESTPISVDCLRKLIALSGLLGNTMFSGDVTGAYLETVLGEGAPEIWCWVPEILRRNKRAYEGKEYPMVRLLKALYGLPRAGHDWDAAMRKKLIAHGWSALDNQNSVYAKTIDGKLCLLGVYVDDMIVSAPDELVDKIRAELSALYPIEWADFTPATKVGGVIKQTLELRFLGVKVTIKRNGTRCQVTFAQTEYAQSIVDMYVQKSGRKCKPATSPSIKVDENAALTKESVGKYKPWCREILGKLLFLERCSRIDIIQAVTHLCGRVCCWSENDDRLLDRLMDYCSGTTQMCLEWDIDSRDLDCINAILLTDADWATDRRNSKSVSSWNLTLIGPKTKATVNWGNRKQTFIARSTAEAETGAFVAGLVAALLPALIFIESIAAYASVNGLKGKFARCTWRPVAKCDNNAACTAMNSRLAGRLSLLSKSSRINLHWARDQLRRSKIRVGRVPTELNSSDLGSKALDQRTHWRLAYTLMTPCKIVYSDVVWEQSTIAGAWWPTGTLLGSPW